MVKHHRKDDAQMFKKLANKKDPFKRSSSKVSLFKSVKRKSHF